MLTDDCTTQQHAHSQTDGDWLSSSDVSSHHEPNESGSLQVQTSGAYYDSELSKECNGAESGTTRDGESRGRLGTVRGRNGQKRERALEEEDWQGVIDRFFGC